MDKPTAPAVVIGGLVFVEPPLPHRTRHCEQLFRRPPVALGMSDIEAPAMIVFRQVGVLLISGYCSRRSKFKSWTRNASHGCVEGAKRCVLGGQGDGQAHGHCRNRKVDSWRSRFGVGTAPKCGQIFRLRHPGICREAS